MLPEWLTRPITLPETRAWRVYTGGRLLEEFRGRDHPKDGQHPEDWIGSTTEARNPKPVAGEGLTRIALPGEPAAALRDLIKQYPEAILGEAHTAAFGPVTGFLVKLLDAAVRLPIQCHPSREYAAAHFGSPFGKTESWIILNTREINRETPYVFLGFREDADEEHWRKAVRELDTPAMESMLLKHHVKAGDVYHVAPGTPHAIGPGVFMVEVQEPTDITVSAENRCADFVMTDAHRFSGVDIETALGAFDYASLLPCGAHPQHRVQPRTIARSPGGRLDLLIGTAQTPYYRAWRAAVKDGKISAPPADSVQVVIATKGSGVIVGGDWEHPIVKGDSVLLPVSCGARSFQSGEELEVILCSPARA